MSNPKEIVRRIEIKIKIGKIVTEIEKTGKKQK